MMTFSVEVLYKISWKVLIRMKIVLRTPLDTVKKSKFNWDFFLMSLDYTNKDLNQNELGW